ncbi:Trk system potassium transporter TrkA [Caproiciproducens sp. NJN-50]|uniref:Trk system potassium transporter TrkA n=1 Tax=Acutalibacteraceae TaxID=3082771 RepID=UPI000FFE2939|nr:MULTISPECIES: Trk system potassium transporter TrkA [Acutalibacteraceae]QAT48382.1 Trk system potassium transporter TrkA [Caproiciproducens sp. NJN-50]
MKIIIVGCGKVGYTLAETLSQESHDVTVVDKCAGPLQKAGDDLDVLCIRGNGASVRTLLEAGVRESDLLIAATSSDELNMLCCLTAKKLGVQQTVARIRDPEYAGEISMLRADLDLDMVINPEQAAAEEIARILQFPPAVNVEPFARGKVELVELKVTGQMPLAGLTLKETAAHFPTPILVGAVMREGGVFIPDGSFRILAGDTVYLVGKPSNVFEFCRQIGMPAQKIKNVMILGGGRLSYYLARSLEEARIRVKIIEIRKERCMELSELLSQSLIICGDGSDDALLLSENLEDMGALIAATGRDEDNLIAALLAKQHGVGKVIAKITRLSHPELVQKMGIDSVVNPRQITTDLILRYVRGLTNAQGNPVNTLYRICGGNAEAAEFIADGSTSFLNVPLRDLHMQPGTLIAAIVHGNEIVIPHGDDVLCSGDNVIVLAKDRKFADLNELILTEEVPN